MSGKPSMCRADVAAIESILLTLTPSPGVANKKDRHSPELPVFFVLGQDTPALATVTRKYYLSRGPKRSLFPEPAQQLRRLAFQHPGARDGVARRA
jgi:hypothetical protein